MLECILCGVSVDVEWRRRGVRSIHVIIFYFSVSFVALHAYTQGGWYP